ncbi:MAG: hypothetical protein R3B40_14450 [Polyangiales bacterium]|nr:hypothetical protein [Sandaracinaceae bacterium]
MTGRSPYRVGLEWCAFAEEDLVVGRVGSGAAEPPGARDALLTLTVGARPTAAGVAVMVDATLPEEANAVRRAFAGLRQEPPARDFVELEACVQGFVERAREQLHQRPGHGASVTAVAWCGAEGVVWHVGEVRAYSLSRGHVRRLTTDDTFQTTRGAWILTRSLGLGRDEPTVTRVSLDGVSDLLLCSSGAHRHADDASFDVLSQDWSRPAQAIDVLRRARAGDPGSGLVALVRRS